MKKNLRYFMTLLLMMVASVGWADEKESVNFSSLGYDNQQAIESYAGTNFTVTFDKGTNSNAPKYYTTGTAIRVYGGNTFTVSSSDNTIIGITLTFSSGEGTNAITADNGTYSNNTWTGSEKSVTFTVGGTTGHRRIAGIEVTYTTGGTHTCATPTFSPTAGTYTSAQNVTINTDTEGATIYYTIDGSTPTTSSDVYLSAINVSKTTTIKAMAVKADMDNSSVATATYTIVAHAGTEADPYTVADARAAIDAGTGTTGVYATGIVSEIVTAYNSQYGNISYNISADGKTSSDQLQAFRGKSYNGENFTSEDDIQVGDVVVIKGDLQKHNSTYEFNADNQLVSLKRTEKDGAGLAYETTEYTINKGESFTAPTLTNPNNLAVTYTSSNESVASVTSDGVVTIAGVGTTIITATFAGDDDYLPGSASYTLTVIDPNVPGSTAENPYTVAQARAAIDAGTGTTGVYATGIVSEIVTAYNSKYGNISYNISADGSTTSAQLQAYRGKSYNGENFTSEDDIQVGDVVVIKGDLQKHNSTYEFNADNQLVSLSRPEKPAVTVSFNELTTTVNISETVKNVATANVEDVTVVYSSSDESIATVNEEGVVTGVAAGTATITASIAEAADYNVTEATYTITVVDPSSSSEPNVATLSNADIVAAGAGAQGYRSLTITDANGKEWNAFAIKNQHSNDTSDKHYLQIKKYTSNTAYYIQVPKYGSKITKLEMTVSNSSKPMDGGGNTATVFFSALNTTSATGDGVASGTGESSITIDCSSLNLNTGYITANAGVRIWDVKVTYEDAESVTINTAESGYTTLVSGKALDIANLPGDLTAYYVTADGISTDKVTLTQVTAAVPAETPLIFKGTASTEYDITIATGETTKLEGNKLAGSPTDPTTFEKDGDAYILSGGEFHPTKKGTFPAGKAYLNVRAANAKTLTISFAETNGINNVNVENNSNDKVFNLAGQQMKSAVKGVYIKNGRKYVK